MGAEAKLTPAAMRERGLRMIAEGHALLTEASLAERGAANDWIDQRTSPLGRRRHLELARSGVLPSRKHGSKVLVRRDDLNAYIEREGIRRGVHEDDDDDVNDVVDTILKTGGGRRR